MGVTSAERCGVQGVRNFCYPSSFESDFGRTALKQR
jgi:hypothetical protein